MQRVGFASVHHRRYAIKKKPPKLRWLVTERHFYHFFGPIPKKVVNRLHQSFRSLMMMVLGFVFMAQDLSVHFVRQIVERGIQVSMGTFAK